MFSLPSQRPRSSGDLPDLPDLPDLLTGRQAADLLGISDSRWRQIVATPDPALRPPVKREGTRAPMWHTADIWQWALTHSRSTRVPVPPLLPLPGGQARYIPIDQRVSGAPSGRLLTTKETSTRARTITAWAELFAPDTWQRAGHDEPLLLLLTPVWPMKWLMGTDLADVIKEASESSGWTLMAGDKDSSGVSVVIVVIDVVTDSFGPSGDVEAIQIQASRFRSDIRYITQGNWRHPWNPTFDAQRESASRIAECLGWKGLPAWPRATNIPANLAAWRPGAPPLRVSVPADVQPQWAAARWLIAAAEREPERANGYLTLARQTAFVDDYADRYHVDEERGRVLAAKVVPEPLTIDVDPQTGYFDVVNDIIARDDIPDHVADALLDYFGDPSFRRPAHIRLNMLPTDWRDLATASAQAHPAEPAFARTARGRRLQKASSADDAAPDVTIAMIGPRDTPVAVSSTHLTLYLPNGIDSTRRPDTPATALPAGTPMRDVLLVRDTDTQVTALGRTMDGDLVPLPVGGGGFTSPELDLVVLRAAVNGEALPDYREVSDTQTSLRAGGHRYLDLLDRVPYDQAQVISWETFTDIVNEPLPERPHWLRH